MIMDDIMEVHLVDHCCILIIGVMDEIIVIYGDDEMTQVEMDMDIHWQMYHEDDDHVENDIMYQVHENGIKW